MLKQVLLTDVVDVDVFDLDFGSVVLVDLVVDVGAGFVVEVCAAGDEK